MYYQSVYTWESHPQIPRVSSSLRLCSWQGFLVQSELSKYIPENLILQFIEFLLTCGYAPDQAVLYNQSYQSIYLRISSSNSLSFFFPAAMLLTRLSCTIRVIKVYTWEFHPPIPPVSSSLRLCSWPGCPFVPPGLASPCGPQYLAAGPPDLTMRWHRVRTRCERTRCNREILFPWQQQCPKKLF